jgi:hypothetical protein
MRKHITIIGVCLLLITLSLSGCEILEEEKDYINVYCTMFINAHVKDIYNQPTREVPNGLLVGMEFIKAGGERFTYQKVIADGSASSVTCVFKLYRDQDIEGIGRIQGSYKGYLPDADVYVEVLSWAVVEPVGFGETFYWHPTFEIFLINNTGL